MGVLSGGRTPWELPFEDLKAGCSLEYSHIAILLRSPRMIFKGQGKILNFSFLMSKAITVYLMD